MEKIINWVIDFLLIGMGMPPRGKRDRMNDMINRL